MSGTMEIKMNDTSTAVPSASTTTESGAAPTANGKTALADAFRSHFSGDAPLADKVKGFAKDKPWASAALLGAVAIAALNSFRGRG